jgi:P27 family predicted phage terminase small subunit
VPAKPVPIEIMQARSTNGKTLGGRDLEVRDVGKMAKVEPPPLPDGIGERGSLEWQKIWTAGRWLWPDQDYHWVEMIARAYDDIQVFRDEIDGQLTVEGYNGQTVAHPLIAEIRKLEATITKCLSQIGFSPTDRARLKLTEAKGEKAARDLLPGNTPPSSPRGDVVQGYVEDRW